MSSSDVMKLCMNYDDVFVTQNWNPRIQYSTPQAVLAMWHGRLSMSGVPKLQPVVYSTGDQGVLMGVSESVRLCQKVSGTAYFTR